MISHKISVALATFNGESYIEAQLKSFVNQKRLPDELVICDDGSTDNTISIIKAFSRSAPFFVNVVVNRSTLGYAQNFSKVLSLCSGDIVFLADQDDYWFSNKLQLIENTFIENPNVQLVINDTEITDAKLSPTGLTKIGQMASAGIHTDSYLMGSCMTVRATFLNVALPVPKEYKGHDGWFNDLAKVLGRRLIVNEVLQYYRRHDDNSSGNFTSGTRKVNRCDWVIDQIKGDHIAECVNRLNRLLQLKKCLREKKFIIEDIVCSLDVLDEYIFHLNEEINAVSFRYKMFDKNYIFRLLDVGKLLLKGDYKYFSGFYSLMRDIMP